MELHLIKLIEDLMPPNSCCKKTVIKEFKAHLLKYLDELAQLFDDIEGLQPEEFTNLQLYHEKTGDTWQKCLQNYKNNQ